MIRVFFVSIFIILNINISSAAGSLVTVCDQMDKVSALIAPITVNPFQTLQITALGPVPGIILAMVQPDSVILDLCKMYKTLQTAKGLDKLKLIGDYTNVLTDNKFSEHISFMNASLDIGESLNNVNKMNQPAIDKFRSLAPRINSYLGSINDYYKYNTGDRIETITSRNERDQNMNALARSSRDLAVYGAALECDTAENRPNTSSQNLYSRDVSTYQNEASLYRADIDYLFDRLKMMGIKFNNGNSGYEAYLRELYNLYNLGVTYEGNIKSYNEKTDYQDPNGKTQKKDTPRSYQLISVSNNPRLFDEFQKEYKGKWDDYISSNFASETKGFLDSRSGRIQEEFYDYSFECRDSFIYDSVKAKNSDYFVIENDPRKERAIRSESDECKKHIDKSPGKLKNIFVLYTELLKTTLPKYKKAQAQIWTIDSYYNGSFRSITKGVVGNDPNGPVREEVSCSKSINLIEQANLKLKIKEESSNLRQQALEELNKETIREETSRAQARSNKDEEDRRVLIQQEAQRRNSWDYSKYKDYPESSGGI
jgi:hypothetical protein